MNYGSFQLMNAALNQAKAAVANARTAEEKQKAEAWLKRVLEAHKKAGL